MRVASTCTGGGITSLLLVLDVLILTSYGDSLLLLTWSKTPVSPLPTTRPKVS